MSSKDDDVKDEGVEDYDLVDQTKYFQTQLGKKDEREVSLKEKYIVSLAQFPTHVVAAALNGNDVALFNVATGMILEEKNILDVSDGKKSSVCGIKCHPQNDNELFICSSGSQVLLYDLRTKGYVSKFTDLDQPTTFTAFDVNSNGRMICVGSEQSKSDVFLSFFDVRQCKVVGGYFESHEADISVVKFHETNPNLLITGATDGLINHFDISEINEDEAIQCTFNTHRSVSHLNWHNDIISCITDSNEVIFYNLEDIEVLQEFSRPNIAERLHRNRWMDCHLIDSFNGKDTNNSITVLASSNWNDGECLRTLTYDINERNFKEHGNFCNNRQIVRCSHYNREGNYFLTGGEKGLLTVWSELESDGETQGSTSVGKSKFRKLKEIRKSKPY